MSTPQDPPVRNKQKRRRTKQLAQWRATQTSEPLNSSASGKPVTSDNATPVQLKRL